MTSRDLHSRMWGEALSLLDQADRLQRQFFRVAPGGEACAWEPPADVTETEDGFCIHVALPGVAQGAVAIELDPEGVSISALRGFPECGSGSRIHRVEIPYGRFRRRIGLPMHALDLVEHGLKDGVLTLNFSKKRQHGR
jgi:HSP20 family molecular chaperone IbpA